ncbi:MAG TPA: hypothetical protein VEZ42_13630, partial [Pseudonocardia sp.]|nr:hypothetical protein [Pseudonocardia sp.]
GINGSAGADRGANWSALGIWGREFLGIELGKHHTGLLGLDIDVRTGRDVGSREPAVETVGAMVWHAIPERDVLDAYAAGRHDLPLDVVADAVERMVSGDLLLDLRTTRLLIDRYAGELTAQAKRAPAALPRQLDKRSLGRYVRALTRYLVEQIDKEVQARRRAGVPVQLPTPHGTQTLEKVVARARRLTPAEESVEVPENFVGGMAESVVERADLADAAGARVELFDQVVAAVEEVAPGALRDTVAWNVLFNQFAGKRWRGHLDRMLGPDGLTVTVPVSVRTWEGAGLVRQTRHVTLTIGAEFGTDTVWAGKTDTVGLIVQDYAYLQLDAGRRHGRGAGVGASGNGAFSVTEDGQVFGPNGGVGTGRDRGRSAGVSAQGTTLRGVAGWDGANRVQHGIRITVRAGLEAAPVVSRLGRLRHRDAAPATAVTGTPIVLSGQMIRLLPDGMVQARAASGRDAGTPLPEQPTAGAGFTLPSEVRIDGRGAQLAGPIGRAMADPRLAGRAGALGHHSALAHTLTPVALSVHLDRIATPDGYRVGRFAVPGAPGEFVDLHLRADLLADRTVIGSRPNTELRSVFRSQSVTSASGNVGHLRPPSWSSGTSIEGTGLSGGGGFGDQSGHNRNAVHGGRGETTLYEKGPATTIAVRVVYHVTLSRVVVRNGVVTRTRYQVALPEPIVGGAYVTAFDSALAGLFRPDWGLDGATPRRDVLPPGTGGPWPVALWGPGPAPHPGGTATAGSFGGGGALAIGGYRATDNALVGAALVGVLERRMLRSPSWPVRSRGPPVPGLQPRERLLVVTTDELASGLRSLGVDPVRAAELAARMYAFSWPDAGAGVDVIAVAEQRLGELLDSGRWVEVLEHERRFHLDGRGDAHDHDADVQRILGAIAVAARRPAVPSGGAAALGGTSPGVVGGTRTTGRTGRW